MPQGPPRPVAGPLPSLQLISMPTQIPMKTVVFSLLLLTSSYILPAQTPATGDAKNAEQGYISKSPLAAGLIRVGKEGIARQ